MANYYATARSNYFAVKDEMSFRQWAEFTGLTVLEPTPTNDSPNGVRRFAITPGNGEDGGWPTHRFDEVSGDYDDLDVSAELSTYLKEDEVAVLMEVGSEKLRHLCGYASAVNSRGETVFMSLDGIYELARQLGPNLTRAEY